MSSKKEKNSDEQFYSLLSSLKRETIAPDRKFLNELRERSAKEFQDSASRGSASSQESTNIIFRRTIMKSRFAKLAAAAAVIILVVLVGLPFVGNKGPGVVLADVLAKVEQTKAFMYKTKITTTGNMMPSMLAQQEITAIVSNEYGIKWEMDVTDPNTGEKMTLLLYVLPDQKMIVELMPKTKQYMRMEFDDDWLARMKKQNNDPREMIKQLMGCQYTELGRSVIDDKEVEGFQTTDPTMLEGATQGTLTLWIDAEKWLPVRAEMDFNMGEQMQGNAVTYDYQWDIPVTASEFEPVIPEDFTAFATDGIKMPGMSEEAAIEGLRLFAEMAGRYPKKIDLIGLGQEISNLGINKFLTDKLIKLKDEMSQTDQMTKEELRNVLMKKSMELTQPLQSPGWFYTMLMKDKKEPVYYGESVEPEDAGAILLLWKVSDGQYRVIFGDLKTMDVSAEQLAELEALQPK